MPEVNPHCKIGKVVKKNNVVCLIRQPAKTRCAKQFTEAYNTILDERKNDMESFAIVVFDRKNVLSRAHYMPYNRMEISETDWVKQIIKHMENALYVW